MSTLSSAPRCAAAGASPRAQAGAGCSRRASVGARRLGAARSPVARGTPPTFRHALTPPATRRAKWAWGAARSATHAAGPAARGSAAQPTDGRDACQSGARQGGGGPPPLASGPRPRRAHRAAAQPCVERRHRILGHGARRGRKQRRRRRGSRGERSMLCAREAAALQRRTSAASASIAARGTAARCTHKSRASSAGAPRAPQHGTRRRSPTAPRASSSGSPPAHHARRRREEPTRPRARRALRAARDAFGRVSGRRARDGRRRARCGRGTASRAARTRRPSSARGAATARGRARARAPRRRRARRGARRRAAARTCSSDSARCRRHQLVRGGGCSSQFRRPGARREHARAAARRLAAQRDRATTRSGASTRQHRAGTPMSQSPLDAGVSSGSSVKCFDRSRSRQVARSALQKGRCSVHHKQEAAAGKRCRSSARSAARARAVARARSTLEAPRTYVEMEPDGAPLARSRCACSGACSATSLEVALARPR